MRRRRRWLYRSEPERTEEALRQTIAELCQALSADRLQQVLRAARYAAEGRNFVLIDLDLWRKPEWRPVLQRLLEEGEPPCPDRYARRRYPPSLGMPHLLVREETP